MIVNVNPYDTGFDENSHVMRFSAIARGVQTTASNKVTFGGGMLRRQISTQFSNLRQAVSGPMKVKVTVPVLPKEDSKNKPTLERQDSFVMVEEELEVVEEDAEDDLDDDRDVLVDHLFEQLRELKERVSAAVVMSTKLINSYTRAR
jgi:kinesin family protein 20